MRADIVPGSVFPDYELSDHPATRRKLSELQGQHPMVLVLSRGGFCPKDRRQAELLVQLHRELEVSYCRLVTISTGVGAHWTFLRMQDASFRRTSISPSTRMRSTIL
jgi:peroxiredoxin